MGMVQDMALRRYGADADLGVEAMRWLISPSGSSDSVREGSAYTGWNFRQFFISNGILAHSISASITASSQANGLPAEEPFNAFVPLEAYQPYPLALLSIWPLDPRPDIPPAATASASN